MHLVISDLKYRIHKMSEKIKVFRDKYLSQTPTPTWLSRCSLAETIKREKLGFFKFW